MLRKEQAIHDLAVLIIVAIIAILTVINCVSIFYSVHSQPALTLEESRLINDPVREKLNNILREKQSRQHDKERH